MVHHLKFMFLLLVILGVCNSLQAQDAHWDCNIHAYRYDMAVYASLQLSEEAVPLASSDYEIAAFYGDECRGVASVQTISSNGNTYYYLRIRSNKIQGEQIVFKCYNRNSGQEQQLFTTVLFEENSVKGFPSQCFILKAYPETTRIDKDRTMVKPESVSVYYLNGTLFRTLMKSDEIEMLPPGIYVINGKKICIR